MSDFPIELFLKWELAALVLPVWAAVGIFALWEEYQSRRKQ